MRAPTLLSWSSGKDAAWALHALRGRDDVEVVGLFTTLNARHDRVAMHAVRRALLEAQAEAAGLPLHVIELPDPCDTSRYDAIMAAFTARARAEGVTRIAFGDLFLADVRRYRESRLRGTGIAPLFPLWGLESRRLAEEMLASGLDARLTCVDPRILPAELAGRRFDRALLDAMPEGADPCGERGEFHTFVCDGPMFDRPVAVEPGETVARDGFVFADVLPAAATEPA